MKKRATPSPSRAFGAIMLDSDQHPPVNFLGIAYEKSDVERLKRSLRRTDDSGVSPGPPLQARHRRAAKGSRRPPRA